MCCNDVFVWLLNYLYLSVVVIQVVAVSAVRGGVVGLLRCLQSGLPVIALLSSFFTTAADVDGGQYLPKAMKRTEQ